MGRPIEDRMIPGIETRRGIVIICPACGRRGILTSERDEVLHYGKVKRFRAGPFRQPAMARVIVTRCQYLVVVSKTVR